MKTIQFFSLLIKLLGLYLLVNWVNNSILHLGNIYSSYTYMTQFNGNPDFSVLFFSIFLLIINTIFPFFLLIKSNWISQLIFKNEEVTEIPLPNLGSNINYSKILQFSIIFIGLIFILTSIPILIINLIDYYQLMMKLGGISSQNPNIKFEGKIYLIKILFGCLMIVKSTFIANLINKDNRFFEEIVKIEKPTLD